MFPRHAVGSVAGFGGMCGYFGASLFQILVGYSVEKHHNYTLPFACAGLAYLAAFGDNPSPCAQTRTGQAVRNEETMRLISAGCR